MAAREFSTPAAVPALPLVYLSQLVGGDVRDPSGDKVATLRDVVVALDPAEPFERVRGLVATIRRRSLYIPWGHVAVLDGAHIMLNSTKLNLQPFERRDGELLLVRDVLDKQIVDMKGRRVVRANDLQLALAEGELRVVGVSVSGRALLRRLTGRYGRAPSASEQIISWTDVESFALRNPSVRLRVSDDRLARLHPIDIAHIIDSLSVHEGAEIVASLDDETAADTLEELSEERQADILEGMDEERAADILEHMGPDVAADALGELSEEKAESILQRMEEEEAEDVRELMSYEEDTAGGIMTTDYVALPPGLTVAATMAHLRGLDDKPEFLHYLYVVDDVEHEQVLGVVSLRDMVLADPATPLATLTEVEFQAATLEDRPRDVARKMAEYNLVALPVLTADGCIQGIVTIDDAIEWLLPDDWRSRLPRIFGS
jgi:magnesium transporter